MSEANPFRDLIQRLCAGDEKAIGELYREYGNTLRLVARGKLKGTKLRRVVDSEDIFHSVMKSFINDHAQRGNPLDVETPEHLLNHLKLLIGHKVIDGFRGTKEPKPSLPPDPNDSEEQYRRWLRDLHVQAAGEVVDVPDPGLGPSAQVIANEEADKARAILAEIKQKLGREDWELLERHYVQGQAYEEIAQSMGVTAAAARQRAHRACERAVQLVASKGKDQR